MVKYKEALESMVWQFAYKDTKNGKPIMWTGGLSALEEAFGVLGWSDPKFIEDIDGCICDAKDCGGWVVAQGGMWRETGYWCLCHEHSNSYRSGNPQPKMKVRALNRETSRGNDGCLPFRRI